MKLSYWKIIAIISIVIALVEGMFIGYSIAYANMVDFNTKECYYNICKDSPEAYYDPSEEVCSCYGYDLYGEITLEKTKYMK